MMFKMYQYIYNIEKNKILKKIEWITKTKTIIKLWNIIINLITKQYIKKKKPLTKSTHIF